MESVSVPVKGSFVVNEYDNMSKYKVTYEFPSP